MITKQLSCRHCASANLTRHGLTNNGKQRYFCHDCQRYSRDNPQPNGYPESARETILRAYDERSSLRGLTRTQQFSFWKITPTESGLEFNLEVQL